MTAYCTQAARRALRTSRAQQPSPQEDRRCLSPLRSGLLRLEVCAEARRLRRVASDLTQADIVERCEGTTGLD
jgi:hypothetical protein